MTEPLTPDICVIGAEAGGLSVAASAAAFGVPAVLIDKGDMGEECVKQSGSLPARALIAAAERANAARNSPLIGVKSGRASVDFSGVNAHMRAVIDAAAPNSTRARFAGLGVRVVKGTARFTDASTVATEDMTVRARRFVIATGSSPRLPAIPGLLETTHFTSETLSDLTERPRHLIVIGAGTVGLELAQAFRRLGSKVTVLEAAKPLANEDPECAAILLDALEREGIELRDGVEIAKVSRSFGKVHVVLASPTGGETVLGSHLLVAAGRRPNIDDLDLDAAGIRHDSHGIIVDRSLRTTNKRVYAIGGVTSGAKFDNAGTYHAGLVTRHALFNMPVSADDHAIARVTFTDPVLAQVGLQEEEARARKGAIRVLRWPFRENDRARVERVTAGHVKVVTDREGCILGATIVGPDAGEGIAIWTLGVAEKLNIRTFAGLAVPHPSYAEMAKYAALTYFTRGLTRAWVRRIMGWLRPQGR